jgi:hypothetical protein
MWRELNLKLDVYNSEDVYRRGMWMDAPHL